MSYYLSFCHYFWQGRIRCLWSTACRVRPDSHKVWICNLLHSKTWKPPLKPPASCWAQLWQEHSQAWKCIMGIMAESVTVCSSKGSDGLADCTSVLPETERERWVLVSTGLYPICPLPLIKRHQNNTETLMRISASFPKGFKPFLSYFLALKDTVTFVWWSLYIIQFLNHYNL